MTQLRVNVSFWTSVTTTTYNLQLEVEREKDELEQRVTIVGREVGEWWPLDVLQHDIEWREVEGREALVVDLVLRDPCPDNPRASRARLDKIKTIFVRWNLPLHETESASTPTG